MSVVGLELFQERFAPFSDSFVLIGGSACDLLFSEQGLNFRATHDLDIVILVEAPHADFAKELWRFINDGGYEYGRLKSPDVHYYRFSRPNNPGYPKMIELFSRHPDFLLHNEASVTVPLPVEDEISSLSAILLDDNYYNFLKSGLININGINVPNVAHLIPLKARAHIDLNDRKNAGQQVDSKNLRKHKNDVIRLISLVPINTRITLSPQIGEDMKRFVETLRAEEAQAPQNEDDEPRLNAVLTALEEIYTLR
ncbi:MAG: hypothetical protein FWF45_02565 [Coriobacteriia bacterium]|nr:hypothetical protein [Coriobacteriia bacterium]